MTTIWSSLVVAFFKSLIIFFKTYLQKAGVNLPASPRNEMFLLLRKFGDDHNTFLTIREITSNRITKLTFNWKIV